MPISQNNQFPADGSKYTILGRVSLSTNASSKGAAYSLLLAEAKRIYPNCDDVVNIMVDAKRKTILWSIKDTYEMTGVAIDYK